MERKSSAARWARWLEVINERRVEMLRHNVALANRTHLEEMVAGLRDLKGFCRPYRGIEFADGSCAVLDNDLVPHIKAEFMRQKARRDAERVRGVARKAAEALEISTLMREVA